jgi:predicted dehydrogenase
VRTGAIGCGDVARYYLGYLAASDAVELAACADRDEPAAARRAAEHGIEAVSVEELLADPRVELVLNLTPASVHAEVTRAALEAGKHVYSEKPLAMTLAEGEELERLARDRGLQLAAAPDTFLGPALQAARRLVDAGELGETIGASASFTAPGSDLWHPNADHLFAAGPVYDEGVYYLTALVALLGPIASVAAIARTVRAERTLATGPRAGERFTAAAPTHWVGTLELASGALATMTMSFEAVGSTQPALELYGTTGTLRLPFPGFYDGALRLGRQHDPPWQELDPGPPLGRVRGPGVEDLAEAIRAGREPRCSVRLALHVLDAMESIARAAESGGRERLRTSAERPEPRSPTVPR